MIDVPYQNQFQCMCALVCINDTVLANIIPKRSALSDGRDSSFSSRSLSSNKIVIVLIFHRRMTEIPQSMHTKAKERTTEKRIPACDSASRRDGRNYVKMTQDGLGNINGPALRILIIKYNLAFFFCANYKRIQLIKRKNRHRSRLV